MARYNAGFKRPTSTQRERKARTENRAGGEAYAQNAELAFASLLLTSFVKNQFYRSADEGLSDMRDLLKQVDPKFAAQAAVYARRIFGMRSISHAVAAEIAHYEDKPWAEEVKGSPWVRPFMGAVVDRVDDMTEILAYYLAQFGKPIPHSLKDGLPRAFGRFDAYQLAKYRAERRSVSLVDAVNLTHPKPTDKNTEALSALVRGGTLRSTETWESKLSQAGQDAGESARNKAQAWGDLVMSGKLGYMALIRNLANIAEQAPDAWPKALEQVADPERVRKGRMFPFQYLVAIKAVGERIKNRTAMRQAVKALDTALELSVSNVPEFAGRTLVAVDDSGSMSWGINESERFGVTNAEVAGIFGGAIYKQSQEADLMVFSDTARFARGARQDESLRSLVRKVSGGGGATNFHDIFNKARKAYDRIIILSDMQAWVGYYRPASAVSRYVERTGANPAIFTFDLSGYGDMQFPEGKVYSLAGVSDKVFDVMRLLEQDRQALVNTIKGVTFEDGKLPRLVKHHEGDRGILPGTESQVHQWETFTPPQGEVFEGTAKDAPPGAPEYLDEYDVND